MKWLDGIIDSVAMSLSKLLQSSHTEGQGSLAGCSPWGSKELDMTEQLNHTTSIGNSQGALVVKNPPANAGVMGSTPGLGRSPRVGNGFPLQYSCLENFMDRGARQLQSVE